MTSQSMKISAHLKISKKRNVLWTKKDITTVSYVKCFGGPNIVKKLLNTQSMNVRFRIGQNHMNYVRSVILKCIFMMVFLVKGCILEMKNVK